jgi:hypothetical protein
MPNVTRSALSRTLAETDPEIASAVANEQKRQSEGLELIESENFVSQAILETAGSVLTNKYAEGYPGRRYYGGCEFVDVAESLAIARAKALFGADHANVQPHSGAQANMTVYFAAVKPGDTVLGMNLAHGGHLTHGHPLNFSGKLYTIVPYGVRKEDERIDYDEVQRLADEHRPKMIITGASAYPRTIDFAAFRSIADEVGATKIALGHHLDPRVARCERDDLPGLGHELGHRAHHEFVSRHFGEHDPAKGLRGLDQALRSETRVRLRAKDQLTPLEDRANDRRIVEAHAHRCAERRLCRGVHGDVMALDDVVVGHEKIEERIALTISRRRGMAIPQPRGARNRGIPGGGCAKCRQRAVRPSFCRLRVEHMHLATRPAARCVPQSRLTVFDP